MVKQSIFFHYTSSYKKLLGINDPSQHSVSPSVLPPTSFFHNSNSRVIYIVALYIFAFTIGTDVTAENDGPDEAEDDRGPSFYDIWDVYVHQFDLQQRATRDRLTIRNTVCSVPYGF